MPVWKRWMACLGVVWGSVAGAATVDVAGVKFADELALGGTALRLNGAGVRYKAIFKVFAGGLYLTRKSATAEEVLSAPGPKRMQINLLVDVEAKKFSKEFIRGFDDNANKSEMAPLVPGLIRMGQILGDHGKFMAGESFTIDWLPGTGAVLAINNKVQGEPFKEVEFYNALLSIWVGKSPADWRFKDAVLGR
ncbi:chalcone isomerase family protein [Curvibacter sp. APW13]|uniref:chalcone isomerase family protein n=1 Tax=Curvibacter sp. APW13 TaxID=3077236 RepID=UPI0028E073BA|nr:chalcone isomerase family protein [Curvibacter sp. APW13]MDT8989305.1 chalcone isomerase family protein [Curvibacter sp. APW13]